MFDLIKRYPWLPSLEVYYSDIATISPLEFINKIFSSEIFEIVKERIIKIFNTAFKNIELIPAYAADDINIYVYIVLRIILTILNDNSISNRIANLYAKTINNELNNEDHYNLSEIYKDLKLNVLYNKNAEIYRKRIIKDHQEVFQTNFKIFYLDYIKLASRFRDKKRKLINNALLNGYIYIQPKDLNRLIQEYVRMKFLMKNKNTSNSMSLKNELIKISNFENLLNEIKTLCEEKKEEFDYVMDLKFSESKDLAKNFPPCVEEILSKAKEGQNLIHTERLFILWFLNALEYPEEEIIKVFSNLPDFDEEKTRYQVNYAIKKKYIPYSCKTLKSYNLCFAKTYKDELCLKGYFSISQNEDRHIAHPLTYIRIRRYRNERKKKEPSN